MDDLGLVEAVDRLDQGVVAAVPGAAGRWLDPQLRQRSASIAALTAASDYEGESRRRARWDERQGDLIRAFRRPRLWRDRLRLRCWCEQPPEPSMSIDHWSRNVAGDVALCPLIGWEGMPTPEFACVRLQYATTEAEMDSGDHHSLQLTMTAGQLRALGDSLLRLASRVENTR